MESLSPFLQGSFTPYNMPVYPGALRFARRSAGISLLVSGRLPRSRLRDNVVGVCLKVARGPGIIRSRRFIASARDPLQVLV